MQNVYMGLDVEDFIFGEGTTYEENYNVSEEDMNRFGIIECTEDPDVACYRIALENEQNHHAIMTAMLTKEYEVLESTGYEMVYEGARIDNFLDAVKAQVQKWWAKVKGVFKKLVDNISSIVLSNKAFVKRYRGVTGLKVPKDKGFTGYDFDKGSLTIKYSDAASYIKTISTVAEGDDEKDKLNDVRGKLLKGTAITSENFEDALKEHLYGSKNSIQMNVDYSFQDLLDRLENASKSKKAAKEAHKEAEKSVKEYLSEINKLKSKASGDTKDEDIKKYKRVGQFITKSLTIMNTAMAAQTRAITVQAVQDRKMANYWVRANNKKDGTQDVTRGVMVNSESFIDGLDVVLI